MILYLIGGGLLALLGYKTLHKPKSAPQAPLTPVQQAAQQQTLLNLQNAAARAGIKPADSAVDKLKKLIPGASGTHEPPHKAVLMQGDPLNTTQGKTYWVTLVTHGLASSAGRDDIMQQASDRGFTDVIPSPVRPADWPGSAQGNWYVKARAARSNTFPRDKGSALAGVTITEAFEA